MGANSANKLSNYETAPLFLKWNMYALMLFSPDLLGAFKTACNNNNICKVVKPKACKAIKHTRSMSAASTAGLQPRPHM